MGAVQKLATVVIVGLVGLATLLVVYLANEPNRRAAEAEEQEEVAIERAVQTFILNCVMCHGPAGEGALAGDGRIGFPLNPAAGPPVDAENDDVVDYHDNQSEDPRVWEERQRVLFNTIHNGRGLMPAFGRGAEGGALLNDEEINELILMIHHVDWNRVYNETIAATNGHYPTAPPPPQPAGAPAQPTAAPAGEEQPPPTDDEEGAPAEAAVITIEGFDIGWAYEGQRTAPGQPITVTVAPGTTIAPPNVGAAPHNFSIDAFGLDVDMPPAQTVEATIPADAAPGEYEFYCNVPGHVQAGMVGTLVVE